MEKVFLKDDGRFRALAEEVIAARGPAYVDLDQVIFATVDGDSGDYLAKATKIPGQYRTFLDAGFMIVFNTMQIQAQGALKKLDLIMYHELLHVNCDIDKLVTHDVEDFSSMIKEFGLNWGTADGPNIVDETTVSKFKNWLASAPINLDREPHPVTLEEVKEKPKVAKLKEAPPLSDNQARIARAFAGGAE